MYLPAGHRSDEKLGAIYRCAPDGADDLTGIGGIRSQTAARLNSLGIYCFGQIARWTTAEARSVCEAIGVPADRAEQEDWVNQARLLCPTRSSASPARSAEYLRLISFAVLSVGAGILVVVLMQGGGSEALPGVLSADSSGVCASEDIVLQKSHVVPGQSVRRGQLLFTVERQSLQEQIAHEKETIEQIDADLRQAEAKARLELDWRLRDLNRELRSLQNQLTSAHPESTDSNVRAEHPLPEQTAALQPQSVLANPALRTVSNARVAVSSDQPVKHDSSPAPRSGAITFFAGQSGKSGTIQMRPLAPEPQSAPKPVIVVPEPKDINEQPILVAAGPSPAMMAAITKEIETLLKHRTFLPIDTVTASGVEQLQIKRRKAVARLEELELAAERVELQAPAWGTVGTIPVTEGELVSKGTELLNLLHTDRRFIVADVSSRRIHELTEGDTVGLSFPGGLSFEGMVASIPLLATPSSGKGRSTVSVRIEPKGKLWPTVPIGTSVDVIPRHHH